MLFSEFYYLKFLYFVSMHFVCWFWQTCVGVFFFFFYLMHKAVLFSFCYDRTKPLLYSSSSISFLQRAFQCSASNIMRWGQEWCEYFYKSHLPCRHGLSTHFVCAHEAKFVLCQTLYCKTHSSASFIMMILVFILINHPNLCINFWCFCLYVVLEHILNSISKFICIYSFIFLFVFEINFWF